MPTIGLDCEVILDGTGYFIKPLSYSMRQPRIRGTSTRADGAASYVDLGAGKREWRMIVLCLNDLLRYDGSPTGVTGQQYRDALRTSFLGSTGTTLLFSDPVSGTAIPVHFDAYSERIPDLRTQIIGAAGGGSPGASYEVEIVLVEA
jgi:hypothetical protein